MNLRNQILNIEKFLLLKITFKDILQKIKERIILLNLGYLVEKIG